MEQNYHKGKSNKSTSGKKDTSGKRYHSENERQPGKGRPKRKRIKRSLSDQKYEKIVPGKKTAGQAHKFDRIVQGEMRLNKYIAHSGICSRREADGLITAGLITVNGEVITELGVKVKPEDEIKYNGEKVRSEKKVYILLNKPKGFVTTTQDPEGRRTVLDLVKNAGNERVYPVGRLDRNTTGLLLLTNDGDLATRLAHPKYNKKKVYHIFLDKNLRLEDFDAIANGMELDDGFIKPDAISWVKPDKKNEVGVEIHSGRNRIIRRIFEKLEYKVVRLDRVLYAGLTKKNLPRGKWRYLNPKEVSILKMNVFK